MSDEKVCPGALCEQPGEIFGQFIGRKYLFARKSRYLFGFPQCSKRNLPWILSNLILIKALFFIRSRLLMQL